jgi:hypothetical protein
MRILGADLFYQRTRKGIVYHRQLYELMMTKYNLQVLFKFVSLLIIICCLAGCWVEHDIVTISADGNIYFESSITVPDDNNAFDFNKLDDVSGKMIRELSDNGWSVSRTWIDKEKPYKFLVKGSGSLGGVGLRTKFYKINKINDNEYEVNFFGGHNTGVGEIRHSLEFKTGVIKNYAEIYNSAGNRITRIEFAEDSETYVIKLR